MKGEKMYTCVGMTSQMSVASIYSRPDTHLGNENCCVFFFFHSADPRYFFFSREANEVETSRWDVTQPYSAPDSHRPAHPHPHPHGACRGAEARLIEDGKIERDQQGVFWLGVDGDVYRIRWSGDQTDVIELFKCTILLIYHDDSLAVNKPQRQTTNSKPA